MFSLESEKFMKKLIKHLTYDERCKIEECINKGLRKFEIANEIDKSTSTILREIRKNRILKPRKIFNENPFNCIYLKDCRVCTGKCKYYKTESCSRRDKYIGACNNCPDIKKCKLDQYFYKAKIAHQQYRETLVDAREGVNLTTSELFSIAHIICPLINQGQSIYTILENHPEIGLCAKTLYNYIEMGLFRDWGISNLSLKRKVKRKIRSKNTLKKRADSIDYTGRRYEDYLKFKLNNPDIATTEMDTVYNNPEGPYIQTFIFENTGLMIGILHSEKTADSMSKAIDEIQEKLNAEEFEKVFRLLLTDRGSEFAKPIRFEVNIETGEIRSNIFYCDAQTPSQKPHVENNHNQVREILPNGQSWNKLTQEKVNIMFSHINSVPRKSLGGKTPYEVFSFIYGESILKKLDIQKIEKDEVNTTPRLLK